MTLEEDVKRMWELASGKLEGDEENWHAEADGIIVKYIPKELAEAYREVRKWYA